MMVNEVFNENDSQKANGLQFNLRKKRFWRCTLEVQQGDWRSTEEELLDYQTLPVHDDVGKKVGAFWKPSQLPKCTLPLQTNETNKNTCTSDRQPFCLEKCHSHRTSKGIFSIVPRKKRHQLSAGQIFHICYKPFWANNTMTAGCVPIELVCPLFTWILTEAFIQNVKKLLPDIESN
jgi:hypothetical protein